MKAVYYEAFRATPSLREVDAPVCPPDGAVVAVRATGVCRSDWHGWMGHDPDIRLPHVPGHEFAGVLHAVGAAVDGWVAGDRVTTPFVNACGRCVACSAGDHQICVDQRQPGFTHWGSFAEYVVVERAAVNLVRLPSTMDFETAAGLGCRFATSYRAITQVSGVSAGQWIAVFGCGGVGLAAVMIARSLGARVIAVDVSGAALDLARSLGAEVSLDASAGPVSVRVHEITGDGAHVTVDALGRAATFADALASLRPLGRHVQVGLLVGADRDPAVDMGAVLARELQIVGSHGMAAHAYPAMLASIAAGTLDPTRLVTRTIPLSEAADALVMPTGPGATVVVL